jgi:hypothetical protein
MEKMTDNRTTLSKFKMQNGFKIQEKTSTTSDFIKISIFKKKLNSQRVYILDELHKIYGNASLKIFEAFEQVVLRGNDLTVALIERCEKSDSIFEEIVRKYESKTVSTSKK